MADSPVVVTPQALQRFIVSVLGALRMPPKNAELTALELRDAVKNEADPREVAEEVGDLLFVAVNVARLAEVDPEAALQGAIERFRTRFQRMESAADASGRELRSLTLEEMERLWMEAKSHERRCRGA